MIIRTIMQKVLQPWATSIEETILKLKINW